MAEEITYPTPRSWKRVEAIAKECFTGMLKIDGKWSVKYDPDNNDRPIAWYRYGEEHSPFRDDSNVVAMFYALLEKSKED